MSNIATLQPAEAGGALVQQHEFSGGALLLDFDKIRAMQALAEVMATAKVTVPAHLAGKAGDCLAVIMQSAQWGMNPFAVAQKTHVVNGALGYEAQLVNAVVQSSGAISGRFHYEYQGDGAEVSCRVGAVIAGEKAITWGEWLKASSVTTKNSPLWKTNPKQQLGYLQVKNWARAFTPGAILGVYSTDELDDPAERNMGAAEVVVEHHPNNSKTEALKTKLGAGKKAEPAMTLDKVLAAIKAATTPEQMTDAGKMAAKLAGEEDKAGAAEAYKARLHELKAQHSPEPTPAAEPSEDAPKADTPKSGGEITFGEVADAIAKSADMDDLALAGDLIGGVADSSEREELGRRYRAKIAEFNE